MGLILSFVVILLFLLERGKVKSSFGYRVKEILIGERLYVCVYRKGNWVLDSSQSDMDQIWQRETPSRTRKVQENQPEKVEILCAILHMAQVKTLKIIKIGS